jgi:hypothetical protein
VRKKEVPVLEERQRGVSMADDQPQIDPEALRREAERTTRSFLSIGEFIFEFSQLEFTIRTLLAARLNLTDEQFDAVVGLYDFSMLCKVTSAILQQQFPGNTREIKEVLEKRCLELNTDRVRIAHGLWMDNTDTFVARHLSRNSLKVEFYYSDPQELDRLTDTARQLRGEVLNLARFPSPGDTAPR